MFRSAARDTGKLAVSSLKFFFFPLRICRQRWWKKIKCWEKRWPDFDIDETSFRWIFDYDQCCDTPSRRSTCQTSSCNSSIVVVSMLPCRCLPHKAANTDALTCSLFSFPRLYEMLRCCGLRAKMFYWHPSVSCCPRTVDNKSEELHKKEWLTIS